MDPMTRDLSCDAAMPPTGGQSVGAVPGVVIPPESLRTLWVLSHDILDLSQELEHGDIQEVALELCDRLADHLASYDAIMKDERSESARPA
ncbi:MAG: hypothetical protein ACREIS_08925 [Nitrospiraceae bacterium]